MAKFKQRNIGRDPNEEDKMVKLSLRISEELNEAVNKLAKNSRVSRANVFRQLAERGLETVIGGTFDDRLTFLLAETERTTKRNEELSKVLVEMARKSEVNASALWDVTLGIANKDEPPNIPDVLIKAQQKGKKVFNKQVDKVERGRDKLSAHLRNDMPEEE